MGLMESRTLGATLTFQVPVFVFVFILFRIKRKKRVCTWKFSDVNCGTATEKNKHSLPPHYIIVNVSKSHMN